MDKESNWSRRGFRPNSWDICYVNDLNLFKVVSLNNFTNFDYEELDDFPGGYSRIPELGEGNLSVDEVFQEGRISYEKYLRVNNFKDNVETKFKYMRRFNRKEFDKCHWDIWNIDIIKLSDKKDVHQPEYDFGSATTPEIPTMKILPTIEKFLKPLWRYARDNNR